MAETETQSSSNGEMLYDAPIQRPAQDKLGRASFASQLADAILKLDAEEGFVFALNGPWGSGKTSILNMALHYIEARKAETSGIVVVRFNPWWFSGQEHLIQQFFRQFRAAIGAKDSPVCPKRIGRVLSVLSKLLAPIGKALPVPAATVIADGLKSFGEAFATMGKDKAEDIHGLRRQIDCALLKQDARIVVVLDDLDRLRSEEIRQVFRLVKAVADFPKTLYLLAFDNDVVAGALNESHAGSGQQYLEKIIQAPMDVPVADEVMLRRYFSEQLDEVLQGTPEQLHNSTAWGNVFWDGIDPFIKTPRHVKRLINRLRATYPMVRGEVHSVDFIAIQCLRTFVPSAYDYVSQNKDLFAGANVDYEGSGYDSRDGRQKRAEAFLDTLRPKEREVVNALLCRTFPLWGWLFPDGSMHGAEWLSEWRRDCRACSPDVFDRYFRLSLPPGDIGFAEMRSVLSLANDTETFSGELVRMSKERRPDGTTRLRAFLERMEDFTKDIPQEHFEPILTSLFNVGDELVDAQNEVGMFDFDDDMRMGRITYQILSRLGSQEGKFELLAKTMTEGRATHRIVAEVGVLGQEHGKFGGDKEPKPETERVISPAQLAELEGIALERIRAAQTEGRLDKAHSVLRILFCWAEWENEDAPVAFVTEWIDNDEGFADFLCALLSAVRSHEMGDRVAKTRWRINVETATKFTRTEDSALADRAEHILAEKTIELTEEQRLALETLVREVREPVDDFGFPRRKKE